MKNWPSYRIWRKQEWQRKWTQMLLRIADRLPDWNIGSLEILKYHARDRHKPPLMSVRCPEGISIRPAIVTYYDLYFSEDFQALQNGLATFLNSGVHADQMIPRSPSEELSNLIETWRTSPIGGAWYQIGCVTFKKYRRKPKNFKALFIKLIQVSPACVNLVLSAFPSDQFVSRFQDLISKEVEDRVIVQRFGILRRQWRSAGISPAKIRQNELEELFLEMNREVVLLLRKFVGRGWAAEGPLPSIQCFTYQNDPWVSPDSRDFFDFWSSLNLDRVPSLYYQNNSGISVFPHEWPVKGTFTSPCRVLVYTTQYLDKKRLNAYASPAVALFFNLEDAFLHPFVPLFALRERLLRAVKSTAVLRDKLSPMLAPKPSGLRIYLQSLWSGTPQLKSLQFSLDRVTESAVQRFLDNTVSSEFRRETQKEGDEGLLTADLRYEVNFLGQHVDEQLSVLSNAYRELWNLGTQWILIGLALITLAIAVAQFIPKCHNEDANPASRTDKHSYLPDK